MLQPSPRLGQGSSGVVVRPSPAFMNLDGGVLPCGKVPIPIRIDIRRCAYVYACTELEGQDS